MSIIRFFIIPIVFSINLASFGQPGADTAVNQGAARAMKTFNVPGMSIAIVQDGKPVMLKGYGVRSVQTGKPVDAQTLFGIASNSKAFTTAALSILVQEGKLKWDDLVKTYIPEFKMYDPWVTAHFTITDLVTHRSGLATGSGDLLHNPDPTDFTIKDVLNSLQYLKPATDFRSHYAYDNILYLVAAELVARVSGLSWGDFLTEKIFKPLGMTGTAASFKRIKDTSNVIHGHEVVEGHLHEVPPPITEQDAGAGGIYSSAEDLAKWMICQLNEGKFGPGLQDSLFSPAIHEEMWTPQVVIPVHTNADYRTHFGAYGLGWFLTDLRGYKEVSHTGEDEGMISAVELIPELHLGIAICTNMEGGGAVRAMMDHLLDIYTGAPEKDRIAQWAAKVAKSQPAVDSATERVWEKVDSVKNSGVKTRLDIKGVYADPWFGRITISMEKGRPYFRSVRSPHLSGIVYDYSPNCYVVKWDDRSMHADAFLYFSGADPHKPEHLTLKPISPHTSPAFDFRDLSFKRVNP